MVGAEDVVEDVGALDFVPEVFGDQEVVDAPAYVPFAGVHTVGPPGVFGYAGVEGAPGVYEACVKQLSHLGAFLVGEAGVEVVGGGVLEVDLQTMTPLRAARPQRYCLKASSHSIRYGRRRRPSWELGV